MIAGGDWVVPRLDGMRYFEKPALGYWLTASSMVLFGQNPFAVRLPVALSAGGAALALFLLVRRFSFAKGVGGQRPRSGRGGGRGGHPADEFHVLHARLLQHAGHAADDVPDRGGGPFLFRVRDGEPAAQGAVPAVFRRRDRVRVPDEGVSGLRLPVRGGRAVHALGAADRKAPAAGVAAAADDGAGRAALVPDDLSARTGFLAAVLLGAALAPVLERARAACPAALVLHPVDRRRHPAVDGAGAGGDHRPRKGKAQGPADPFRAVLARVPVPLLLHLQRQAAHVHPALFSAAGAADRRGTAPVFRPRARQGVRRRRVGRHSAARRGHRGDHSRQRDRRRRFWRGRSRRPGNSSTGRTNNGNGCSSFRRWSPGPRYGSGGAGRALRCTGWRCCARGRAFSWWPRTA